jgi:hypothetical protein
MSSLNRGSPRERCSGREPVLRPYERRRRRLRWAPCSRRARGGGGGGGGEEEMTAPGAALAGAVPASARLARMTAAAGRAIARKGRTATFGAFTIASSGSVRFQKVQTILNRFRQSRKTILTGRARERHGRSRTYALANYGDLEVVVLGEIVERGRVEQVVTVLAELGAP